MKTKILSLIIVLITVNSVQAKSNSTIESKESQIHLTMLYEHYINLKSAFLKSNNESIIAMAKEVQREMPNVEKAFDKLKDNTVWKVQLAEMKSSLNAIVKTKDIEKQRANFTLLSKALFQNIKAYGVIGMPVYYQFCSKALNGKGAYWLSLKEKIQNPYAGEKMMTCGKTKEIIK